MEKTEQLTNEYIAKELSRLREIRERLESEYEYMAFRCKHGIGDVEATREEAYRLGRILGKRNNDIRVETQTKSDNIKCKNPKNKDVLECIERLKNDVSRAEKEIEVFTVCAVAEDIGVITGSIGKASQLVNAIAFLINDIENHSAKGDWLMPNVEAKYVEIKAEMSDTHADDN